MAEHFRDNETGSRFELDVDGAIAFVTYRKSPGTITLEHTEVPPELGGKGIGSKLARATLEAVRRRDASSRSNASSFRATCASIRKITICWPLRRVGKGALAPCPSLMQCVGMVGTLALCHPRPAA